MQSLRRVLGLSSIIGLSVVALAASGGAGGSPSVARTSGGGVSDLTGRWSGSDGSTYYIRQVGRTAIWWVGLSGQPNSDSLGRKYTNIFRGTITRSTIRGDWVGTPRGETLGGGRLTLKIEASDPPKLRKTQESGTALLTRIWEKE